ncbi:hypothetical protein ACVXHA_01255 [Escherichia coli]
MEEVDPYPLDVLVAESRDDWLYAGAELAHSRRCRLSRRCSRRALRFRLMIPRLLQPEKFIGPVYQPEEQRHWKRLTAGRNET